MLWVAWGVSADIEEQASVGLPFAENAKELLNSSADDGVVMCLPYFCLKIFALRAVVFLELYAKPYVSHNPPLPISYVAEASDA